jgi:hypothetical protein
MKKKYIVLMAGLLAACTHQEEKKQDFTVHLITVDPGHFHAALVQKSMYPEVDSVVQMGTICNNTWTEYLPITIALITQLIGKRRSLSAHISLMK